VILMAIFTSINFLGIRKLAHTNSAATWWKIGIPLLTIFVLGIVNFHASNFTAADGFSPFGAKGVLAAVSTSGIIFALLGFEQADQLAGESARPKRDIPRAVIFSVIIGAVIYVALQVVFLGALPADQIGHSWAHGAYTTMTGPFAQLATLVAVGWLAAGGAPGRRPARPVAGAAGLRGANSATPLAGLGPVRAPGRAIPIGYVILAVTRIFGLNPRSPQLDLKAASWLPVYLVGMGAIVYLSDFGPMTNPVFPLWWDMVAVTIFSAIVYFWAMAVALPTERIEQMIAA